MNEYELTKLNTEISDKCVYISNLIVQYSITSTPEERMKLAINMENMATSLRINAEKLASETCRKYKEVK